MRRESSTDSSKGVDETEQLTSLNLWVGGQTLTIRGIAASGGKKK
jgi:hypothetical protein